MDDSTRHTLEQKFAIADAYAALYTQQQSVSLHQIARAAGITVSQLFTHFDDKDAIIYFYYEALIIRYGVMIEEIQDFENFTLSEKLSNFAYASFDLMDERFAFVEQTFTKYMLRTCKSTQYNKRIDDLLAHFLETDSGKAASSELFINDYSLALIRKKYVRLVQFWINDDSEGKEKTMELTDKVTGLMQEALYTSFLDRSFDLAKFLFSNQVLAKKSRLWNNISSTFEIK